MNVERLLEGYAFLGGEQLSVAYVKGDEGVAQTAVQVLTDKRADIFGIFRVENPFPQIRVVLVPDRAEFDRLVRDLLKIEIEVPSHPARIAQPQRTDMVVLSPTAYPDHSIFEYVPDEFRRLLVHELIHMVEEFLSPDIESIPGWWSEGLAVYFSEQARFEDGFRKVALDAIASEQIPDLDKVLKDGRMAYDWGWTLVQWIDRTMGRDVVLKIVRECVDGDVVSFLGRDFRAMEEQWTWWLTNGGYVS